MIFSSPKSIIFLLALCICFANMANAQDFYKDYRNYLLHNTGKVTARRVRSIDTSIKRMRLITDKFEQEKGHSFFTSDTVYNASFLNIESGSESEIIWNKNASCYYSKRVNQNIKIQTDASDILKSFSRKFRQAIESGDTSGYHKYADRNRVLDGQFVSPLMAIKKNKHWEFVIFPGNGSTISYDFDIEKGKEQQSSPFTLTSVVERIIRRDLHFNIDSAKSAYESVSNKISSQPAFPVIILDDKVIAFEKLKEVNLSEVKTIDILNSNDSKQTPYAVNKKYGVIIIATNGKKKH